MYDTMNEPTNLSKQLLQFMFLFPELMIVINAVFSVAHVFVNSIFASAGVYW